MPTFSELTERFEERHIGPRSADLAIMLDTIGVGSADELIAQTVPDSILDHRPLCVPDALGEAEALSELRSIAEQNQVLTNLIGLGYHGTALPPVIRRNVLEAPGWYTAYTPYQPEISQGRLEALINFQTMVCDLTGLDIANSSLLDEATAAAEAMALARRTIKGDRRTFFVHADTHPQTLAVLETRAEPVGVRLVVGDDTLLGDPAVADDLIGGLLSYPTSTGAIVDWSATVDRIHDAGGLAVVATDLLACVLLRSPGALGADIAIGSAQRFGVPIGYGGPHAGFMAVRSTAARSLPGRLVGVSTDTGGRPALRLALQTREQHIRREKATSNICTAQVLLANIAGLYAAWHGPDGLTAIASRVHGLTNEVARRLSDAGRSLRHDTWFDTLAVDVDDADATLAVARELGFNLRRVDDTAVGISFDELSTPEVASKVLSVFGADGNGISEAELTRAVPAPCVRTEPVLPQAVFNSYHSEHEMLRYLRRLSDRDLALDRTMIPLGSCTMKLNATSEMEPITWPEFADVHPAAPADQTDGYRVMIEQLESALAEITGYAAVSVQPNAGSQGEFAGLLAIRGYHLSRGDDQRTICLIPASAHGTNAASAVMAGMDVAVVKCDDDGNVDLDDLDARIEAAGDRLSAIMITYPSTHGVFETAVESICDRVHVAGGQVYVDGANLNAMVGLARPALFGADVSHLNLHKTFCIPHGGGGPGVGPIGVREHLVPFLPGDPLGALDADGQASPVGPVSAAKYGSAGILPISWMYLRMMGPDGLRRATVHAIVAANYVASRLDAHFPVLYTGHAGRVAHECIIDLRDITKETGVTVDDVAKRLIDYGFHAPTMSFPVAGTLMIEPTESEELRELDRFCEAMIQIRREIADVERGDIDVDASPLRHAPHTADDLIGEWDRAYSRETGAYPTALLRTDKYFPPVSRIDGAYGDRHLVCSCEPLEAYATELAT